MSGDPIYSHGGGDDAAGQLATAAQKLTLSEGTAESQPAQKLWLEAWYDPVASVKAYTPCITTADLFGDGDWRLVVASMDKKLKVWKGTEKKAEQPMLEIPVAVVSFNSAVVGNMQNSELPALAAASGSSIYIYRNLRPYYKFTLPAEPVNADEASAWQQMSEEGDVSVLQGAILRLRDAGVALTQQSTDFLLQPPEQQAAYADRFKGQAPASYSCITCLSKIFKSHEEPGSVACLMVGTESGKVLLLNTLGTSVDKTIAINGIPTHIVNTGVIDVEWRSVVACRDGKVFQLKNGEVQSTVIELEHQCVGLLRNQKSILIGCMNNTIHNYQMKGRKSYSIFLPSSILAMVPMKTSKKLQTIFTVALANNEVRVYNEKHCLAIHSVTSPVTALYFGPYGREDSTLIAILKSGALDIKILPRLSNLETSGTKPGPPPEQDIPLDIPKKTKQYVEQTQRERDQAVDMHRIFQRDLCKLRLMTARAYVKVLTDGKGAISYTTGAALRLKADIAGLGPRFILKMRIQNTGAKPVMNMPIMLVYNDKLYSAEKNQVIAPLLVPHVEYDMEVALTCLDPAAQYSDELRIVMVNGDSAVPILSALVRIPLSDVTDM